MVDEQQLQLQLLHEEARRGENVSHGGSTLTLGNEPRNGCC